MMVLMVVLKREKGWVSNSAVNVIYDTILQSKREKHRSLRAWGLN